MARPARIFLAAELLLGTAYFPLPDSLPRAAVYCLLGLGMVAAGQLSFTVGDAINYTYQ